VYKYASANNVGWKGMLLNSSNTKSDILQFKTIDIQEIIPDALLVHPYPLASTEANCSLIDARLPNIDDTYRIIKLSAIWSCDLLLYNTSTKLISIYFDDVDVHPKINYEVRL
jgi:hypothetical protein